MPKKVVKPSVTVVTHAAQARKEYPDELWATDGSPKLTALGKKPASKLTKYESYLVQTHFPAQAKRCAQSATPPTPEDEGVEEEEEGEEEGEEGGAEGELEEEEEDGAVRVSQNKNVQHAMTDNADNSEPENGQGEEAAEEADDVSAKNPEVAQARRVKKRPAPESSSEPPQADRAGRVSKDARRASASASQREVASKKSRREVQATEQEASDDDESGIGRRRQKSTDSKLYKTYVAGKVLPAELRSWFLISILARDGADTQGRSPNRRMNLLTLISLVKNQVKLNEAVFKEFKSAVLESLDTPGERYVFHRMC
jgi:hypothetical protein